MKKQELISFISNNKIWSLDDAAWEISEYCSNHEVKEPEIVAEGLYEDRHRWYDASVTVYECEDGYVGIYGVERLLSESMDYEDTFCECEANEYNKETITKTIYYKI